jgi:hypothetical protein
LLFLAVWLASSASAAQDVPLPGTGWSEPERWAWEEIRAGRIADFDTRDGRLDPRQPDGWGDQRKLSPDFLKEILFREPYMSALPIEGVRIVGAWFSEPVDLASGRLDHQLWLDRCRFEKTANLIFLQANDLLSLEGSAFAGQGDGLVSVDLTDAKIAGPLNMAGAHVARKLNMSGLEVGQDLFMTGPDATFHDVDLVGAKVGGHLDMHGATVEGKLDMKGLEVGEDLAMYSPAAFHDVDLGSAKIGGQLDMHGAIFDGKLEMYRLEVGGAWPCTAPPPSKTSISWAPGSAASSRCMARPSQER